MAENIIPTFGAHVVPKPEHPLYEKLKEQPVYIASSLARHALLRHVRLKKEDVPFHLNMLAGFQLGSVSNKDDWDNLFVGLVTDYKTLNMFINASTYWLTLVFKEPSEYPDFITTIVSFCEMQFTGNNLTPPMIKKDFDVEKARELLLENPLILFLLLVFISGPLSKEEIRGITLEVN